MAASACPPHRSSAASRPLPKAFSTIQQTVISAIEGAGLDSSRIAPLLKSAAVWSARLQFEQAKALSSLIDRVDLGQDGVRLSIKLPLSNAECGAPDGTS